MATRPRGDGRGEKVVKRAWLTEAVRLAGVGALCLCALAGLSCGRQRERSSPTSAEAGASPHLGRPCVTCDGRAVFCLRQGAMDRSVAPTKVLVWDAAEGCREVYSTTGRVAGYALADAERVTFILVERSSFSEIVAVTADGRQEALPLGPELAGWAHGEPPTAALAGWDRYGAYVCRRTGQGTWRWAATAPTRPRAMVWAGSGDIYIFQLNSDRRTTRVLRVGPGTLGLTFTTNVQAITWAAEPLGGPKSPKLVIGRAWEGTDGQAWAALSILNAETGAVRDIATMPPGAPGLYSFSSSADGSHIACIKELTETSHQVVVLDVGSGRLTVLAQGGTFAGPFFVSDTRVGFFEETPSGAALWSIGMDGSDRRQEWTTASPPGIKP